ncbi:hypothetical protein [Actinoplanes palleronii]|uniref:Uncharacterized protein n=1 Tax=Actinoplanes palleronii TaxID=113570 RepID=A0ABQ4BFK3_9ACTN|nr:hypothetical protein [Actinoplanes palleronii]GIE69457.1 hypothetical protein Apa02nite_055650 [Actinoplanes palleronii]
MPTVNDNVGAFNLHPIYVLVGALPSRATVDAVIAALDPADPPRPRPPHRVVPAHGG